MKKFTKRKYYIGMGPYRKNNLERIEKRLKELGCTIEEGFETERKNDEACWLHVHSDGVYTLSTRPFNEFPTDFIPVDDYEEDFTNPQQQPDAQSVIDHITIYLPLLSGLVEPEVSGKLISDDDRVEVSKLCKHLANCLININQRHGVLAFEIESNNQ